MKTALKLATAFALTIGVAWGADKGYDSYQGWQAEGGQGLVAQSEGVSSAEADRLERQGERDEYVARYGRIIERMDMLKEDTAYWIQQFIWDSLYGEDMTMALEELGALEPRLVALIEEFDSLEPPAEYRREHDIVVSVLSDAQYDFSQIYENALLASVAYDATEEASRMWAHNDNIIYGFSFVNRDLDSVENEIDSL